MPMIRHRSHVPTGALVRALAALALLAATGLVVEPADGQVTGGCSATVNGQDADTARSARSAIVVDADDTIVVTGQAPGPITGYDIHLTFAGIRIPAASGTVGSGETSYTRSVDVADYAVYGVGLYRVEGETRGTVCTGWAYVKVTGRFPLFTVAGAAGAVLTGAGAIGMALSRPRRARGVVT